jgi:tetratricopeptide (TPR) repeat protein
MHVAIQLLADSSPLEARIGVNSGHVFVGPVGPPSRRAYVTMGDTANLAARVMAKAAWGQVLVTASSIEAANDRFVLRDVPPFQVKGKLRPVEAKAIEALAVSLEPRSASTGPFVGREGELNLLRSSLESALSGRGQVVEILGEQGVGKSRLVAEFRSSTGDASWVTAACDPFERTTPYQTARLLARRVLGIERDATAIEAGTRLEAIVEKHAPRLLPWLPLIAVIVDAEVAATEESSDVDPRFRRVKAQQVVADLIEAIRPGPAVISIEDAEHMDDASAELISELLGRIGDWPWLVVITRAPGKAGLHHGRGYQATVVDLQPLDHVQAAELARRLAEKSPVPPHLLPEIVERAAGNPMFLSEMLAHAGTEIPHSVEDIVSVRIDALAPPDRSALRHMAVLGQRFDLGLVESVLGDRGVAPDDDDLWSRLSGFVEVVGREVVFANPLVRQVAYDGLPYRTRRELHGRVADALGPDRRDQLPLHLVEAERWHEAWQAARRAGDRARDAAANAVAGELYELALRAANSVDGIDDHEVGRVAEDAARVWARAGVADRALDALRVAIARATDPIEQLELEALRASVHEDAGRYPQALRLFATSLTRLDDVDAPGRDRARAELHAGYASTRLLQGQFDEAQPHAEAAVSAAEAAGDRRLQARGLHLLDRIHAAAGDFERAQYYRDAALPIFAELGDLAAQGTALHDLAADEHRSGRFAEAMWLYQRAADSRSRAGDVVRAAATINSLGQVEQALGMLDSAEQRFTEALRTWRGARSPQGVAEATTNLGELRIAQGRVEEAKELLEEAERLALDLGLDDILARGQVALAEAYEAVGRHVEAWERATVALQRTTVSSLARRARSVRAEALEATGSIERAVGERELALSLGGPPRQDSTRE